MGREFVLSPNVADFNGQMPSEVQQFEVEGGLARTRRVSIGSRVIVSCTWSDLLWQDYEYWRDFYRAATLNGSTPFDIYLRLVTQAAVLYEDVYFFPGSHRLNSISGDAYSVSAQLVVDLGS